MPELGIRLEDDGLHLWTAVPAETLKQQIQQKKQQALQLALDKKAKRRVALQNEIRRWEEWSQNPEALFTQGSYSHFENGFPTHDTQGSIPLSLSLSLSFLTNARLLYLHGTQ